MMTIDEKLDSILATLSVHTERFDKIDIQFKQIGARFDAVADYIHEFKREVIAKLDLYEELAEIRERLTRMNEASTKSALRRLEEVEAKYLKGLLK